MLLQLVLASRTLLSNNGKILILPIRLISQSYYDILNVSQSCTSKEIREAFILLSKKNHPDKHLNDPSMHEKFVQINEAYSTLINPSKRRAYDLTLYHKRKLNAPYERSYAERQSSTYAETFHRKSTKKTSYRADEKTNRGYEQPRSEQWDFQGAASKGDGGLFRARRFSNRALVSILVVFTFLGAMVQFFAIRRSFMSNQEKMVERSKEYGLIHSMAREKARLYGNARQIEILKRNLSPEPVSTAPAAEGPLPSPSLVGPIPPPSTGLDKCQRHASGEPSPGCPRHLRPSNPGQEENKKVCKKCNKHINK